MRVYISGPISANIPGVSYRERKARFGRAEKALQALGHDAVSPLKVDACRDLSCGGNADSAATGGFRHVWKCYMKYDIIALLDCEVIALLPHWNLSPGAACEYQIAHRLDYKEWLLGKTGEILAHSIF